MDRKRSIRGGLPIAFEPTKELLARMERQLARFDRAGDHRAAFLRVYAHMTHRVLARMESGFFLDPAWLERVALRFAAMYFDALEAYELGHKAPPAWQLAFDSAVQKRCFLLQDILLGVNAHINNDLAQVMATILHEEDDRDSPWRLERRRFDHDQINRILHEIVPAVEGEVARHYGRLIGGLGWVMGGLDESLAAFELKQFRDRTWRNGLFLLAAQSEAERKSVRGWVERDALNIGEQVVRFGAPGWSRPLARTARALRLL